MVLADALLSTVLMFYANVPTSSATRNLMISHALAYLHPLRYLRLLVRRCVVYLINIIRTAVTPTFEQYIVVNKSYHFEVSRTAYVKNLWWVYFMGALGKTVCHCGVDVRNLGHA